MIAIGCILSTVCAFADDCVLNVWEGLGRAQSIKDVATKFEQDTKCKVRISEFEISSQLDKVRKGESPDIFVIEGERVIGAANHEGLLSDIEIMKKNKDKYHEAAIKQVYFSQPLTA